MVVVYEIEALQRERKGEGIEETRNGGGTGDTSTEKDKPHVSGGVMRADENTGQNDARAREETKIETKGYVRAVKRGCNGGE